MDVQKSADIDMDIDIHNCWMSVFIIHKSVDIYINIQARISMQGHSAMDIQNNKYPLMDIHIFMDISLQLSMLLWISIWISLDFHGHPCIDLLRILDPGHSYAKLG